MPNKFSKLLKIQNTQQINSFILKYCIFISNRIKNFISAHFGEHNCWGIRISGDEIGHYWNEFSK